MKGSRVIALALFSCGLPWFLRVDLRIRTSLQKRLRPPAKLTDNGFRVRRGRTFDHGANYYYYTSYSSLRVAPRFGSLRTKGLSGRIQFVFPPYSFQQLEVR